MIRILPTFKGYTVDMRLKEFRKAVWGEEIEFLSFERAKGKRLLIAFLQTSEGEEELAYYKANN
jgi:hypothetical protein